MTADFSVSRNVLERVLPACLLLAVAAFGLLYATRPVDDPDFWWHLATGKYIATHRALPDADPFTFSGPGAVELRERLILTSYWLAQLTYYFAHAAGGLLGVIALRAGLLVAMFWTVFARMRRLGVAPLPSLLVLAASLLSFGAVYTADRPQTFTFLFAAVLLGMLESIREGGRPSWLLPPLMALWANVHGGFVVGDLLLAVFAVGCLIEYRREPKKMAARVAWAAGGIAASLANPNGYLHFGELLRFMGQDFAGHISEYISTAQAFARGETSVVLLWLLLGLTLLGLALSRRIYWPDLLLIGVVGCMAVTHFRNVAFYSVGMAPFAAFYLDRGLQGRSSLRRCAWWAAVPAVAGVAAFAGVLSTKAVAAGAPLRRSVSAYYSEQAASFIEQAGIRGNMLNDYDWGGFLIWRLFPQHRVFIDGRGLHEGVFRDYLKVVGGSTETVDGREEYAYLLDRYRIEFIVQRTIQRTGKLQPLMKRILNRRDWAPVYSDGSCYILVRVGEQNGELIRRYQIDKLAFLKRILADIESLVSASPGDPRHRLAKAELLIYLGYYEQARAVLEQARALAPGGSPIRAEIEKNLGQITNR
jgi:hypothetical protein